jgi:prepilin-type processing-associated H-X9-DG protein
MHVPYRFVSTRYPAGITLVEVLVSIGVIGVLGALLFPAIQQGREAARRNTCKNNLYQIGVATQNFHDVYRKLPDTLTPFERLLPFVGEEARYRERVSTESGGKQEMTGPSIYVCPSDPEAKSSDARVSYSISRGSLIQFSNGIFQGSAPSRLGDVTDGLSNTALYAERLVFKKPAPQTREQARLSPQRAIWIPPRSFAPGEEKAFGEFAQQLESVDQLELGSTGNATDFIGSEIHYNHLGTPNLPWLFNGDNSDLEGLRPPGSMHNNGVNLLMCDGSVHFISDQIDDQVWRAIGSRNGNEPVPLLP